jgi:hypothetical protein
MRRIRLISPVITVLIDPVTVGVITCSGERATIHRLYPVATAAAPDRGAYTEAAVVASGDEALVYTTVTVVIDVVTGALIRVNWRRGDALALRLSLNTS